MLTPGLNIINPCTNSVIIIDMKTKVAMLQQQPVLSKDNITIKIQCTVFYRVVDSFKVSYKLGNNPQESFNFISEMAHAALRSVVG